MKSRSLASGPARFVAAATIVAFSIVPCTVARAGADDVTLRPPADIPLGHWSYAHLDRLASRGLIDLELTTLPVSRDDVRSALEEARDRRKEGSGRAGMTTREAWAFERLEAEFLRSGVDRPTFAAADETAVLGLGVRLATTARYRPDGAEEDAGSPVSGGSASDDFDPAVQAAYELWGGVPGLVGFYSDALVLLSGQEGRRQVQLSGRARTWRGVAATAERAYFKLERPRFSVTAGRGGEAWGRSRRSGLLLSGTAATFDRVAASFNIGSLSFAAMHARLEYEALGTESELDDSEAVYLAGHRAVFGFAAGSVGFSETVVYSSVRPDPVYLNPLVPYYLSQHNERANDNVLWSLDVLLRPARGLDVYAEFVVDDLMYERNVEHPDKYGFCVGQAYNGSLGDNDFEVTLEYAHVRKWTYTHSMVEHRLVHDGRPIGFELGPDADRVGAVLDYHPALEWTISAGVSLSRKGEGETSEPYEEGSGYEPEFPSGVVERESRFSAAAVFDDLSGLAGRLGAAYLRIDNEGNVSGADDDRWEFWGSIGFRI